MRVNLTAADLLSATGLTEKAVAKLFESIDFDDADFSHAEIQYCLTNDIEISGAHLYSPVQSQAAMETDVPAAWPNSAVLDEDGEVVRQKTWFEYTQWHEVTGGYSIKFSGSPADENKNITLPSFSQIKTWVNKVGGFLTKAEFEAIRVVPEP